MTITQEELNDLETIVADVNKKADSQEWIYKAAGNRMTGEYTETYTFTSIHGDITLIKSTQPERMSLRTGNICATSYRLRVDYTNNPHHQTIEMIEHTRHLEEIELARYYEGTTIQQHKTGKNIQTSKAEKRIGIPALYEKIDSLAKERTLKKNIPQH